MNKKFLLMIIYGIIDLDTFVIYNLFEILGYYIFIVFNSQVYIATKVKNNANVICCVSEYYKAFFFYIFFSLLKIDNLEYLWCRLSSMVWCRWQKSDIAISEQLKYLYTQLIVLKLDKWLIWAPLARFSTMFIISTKGRFDWF